MSQDNEELKLIIVLGISDQNFSVEAPKVNNKPDSGLK